MDSALTRPLRLPPFCGAPSLSACTSSRLSTPLWSGALALRSFAPFSPLSFNVSLKSSCCPAESPAPPALPPFWLLPGVAGWPPASPPAASGWAGAAPWQAGGSHPPRKRLRISARRRSSFSRSSPSSAFAATRLGWTLLPAAAIQACSRPAASSSAAASSASASASCGTGRNWSAHVTLSSLSATLAQYTFPRSSSSRRLPMPAALRASSAAQSASRPSGAYSPLALPFHETVMPPRALSARCRRSRLALPANASESARKPLMSVPSTMEFESRCTCCSPSRASSGATSAAPLAPSMFAERSTLCSPVAPRSKHSSSAPSAVSPPACSCCRACSGASLVSSLCLCSGLSLGRAFGMPTSTPLPKPPFAFCSFSSSA